MATAPPLSDWEDIEPEGEWEDVVPAGGAQPDPGLMAELEARTAEGARLGAKAESLSPTGFWGKVALPQRATDVALGKLAGVAGPSSEPFSEQARAAFVPPGHQELTPLDFLFGAGLPASQQITERVAPQAARFTEAAVGGPVETVAGMAVDPLNLVFAGLGKLGRAGAALQALLGAAFAGHMGKEGLAAGKEAIDSFRREGLTPETIDRATQALTALAGAALGAVGGAVGLKETVVRPPKFTPREQAARVVEESARAGRQTETYRQAVQKAEQIWKARAATAKAKEAAQAKSRLEHLYPELAGVENTEALLAAYPELAAGPSAKAATIKKAIEQAKATKRAKKGAPSPLQAPPKPPEAGPQALDVLSEAVPPPAKAPSAADLPRADLATLYTMGYKPLDLRSMSIEEAQGLLAARKRAFGPSERAPEEQPRPAEPEKAAAEPTGPTDEAVAEYLQSARTYLERYVAPKGRLALREGAARAKEEVGFDVPELAGLGERKLAQIIAAGPDHPAYGRVFRAAKRAVSEMQGERALPEAQAAPGEAQTPPGVPEGPGGQPGAVEAAPGGAVSAEELMRAGRREQYWKISRSGEVTYQGAQPDPTRALRPGEAIIRTLPGQEPSVVQANAIGDTPAIEAFQRTDAWKEVVAQARPGERGAVTFGGGPLAGKRVELRATGERGTVQGIEPNGRIRVLVSGATRSVRAEEVSFLPPETPAAPTPAAVPAPEVPPGEYRPPSRVARMLRAPAPVTGREPRSLGERLRYTAFGERPEAPAAGPPAAASSPVVQKLLARIDYLSREQAATTRLRRPEVARRAGVAGAELRAEPSIEGAIRARGAMRGELPKAEMREPPPWTPEDTDELVRAIVESGKLRPYEAVNASFAVRDAMTGKRVTSYYRKLIRDVFGDQAAEALTKSAPWLKYTDFAQDLVNLPRAVIASFDMSAPLRQGLLISAAHPVKATKAFAMMHRMFVDSGAYDNFVQALRADPDVALFLENNGHVASLGRGEEIFRSQLAERLPVIGRGVRASERAFVGYLDKLTVDVWKDGVSRLRARGLSPETAPREYADLAKWLNVARGRGELPGRSGAIAEELGQVMFSPRLAASRIQAPYYAGKAALSAVTGDYVQMGKAARMEVARSLAGTFALGLGFLGLLKANGWAVQMDPKHVDFGRARKGHLRLDPWGGFQPYARFATTMILGQRRTMAGEPVKLEGKLPYRETRFTHGMRFALQKASPQLRPVLNFLNAQRDVVTGQPVTIRKELYQTLVPMVAQDTIEALQQEGLDAAVLAAPFAFYGGGAAAYRTPEEAAQARVEAHKRQRKVLSFGERYRRARGIPPEEAAPEPSGGSEYFRALR